MRWSRRGSSISRSSSPNSIRAGLSVAGGNSSPLPGASCVCPLWKIPKTEELPVSVLGSQNGHALIVYGERYLKMATGGIGDQQLLTAISALCDPARLRRLSWQSFIGQSPSDPWLDWLQAHFSLDKVRATCSLNRSIFCGCTTEVRRHLPMITCFVIRLRVGPSNIAQNR